MIEWARPRRPKPGDRARAANRVGLVVERLGHENGDVDERERERRPNRPASFCVKFPPAHVAHTPSGWFDEPATPFLGWGAVRRDPPRFARKWKRPVQKRAGRSFGPTASIRAPSCQDVRKPAAQVGRTGRSQARVILSRRYAAR